MDAVEKMLPVPQLIRQNLPVRAVGFWNRGHGLFDGLMEWIARHEALHGAACFTTS